MVPQAKKKNCGELEAARVAITAHAVGHGGTRTIYLNVMALFVLDE